MRTTTIRCDVCDEVIPDVNFATDNPIQKIEAIEQRPCVHAHKGPIIVRATVEIGGGGWADVCARCFHDMAAVAATRLSSQCFSTLRWDHVPPQAESHEKTPTVQHSIAVAVDELHEPGWLDDLVKGKS